MSDGDPPMRPGAARAAIGTDVPWRKRRVVLTALPSNAAGIWPRFKPDRQRKPEGVVDGACRQAVRRLGKGRRLARLFPGGTQVGGAEHRRAEVASLRRRQQGAAVARVELHVADGVAQEVRAVDRPGTALRVAVD